MSTVTLEKPRLTTDDTSTPPEELMRTWGPFLHWLEAQPLDRKVGVTSSDIACPLSNFLADHYGQAEVMPDIYIVQGVEYPLPGWAKAFVHHVDFIFGHYEEFQKPGSDLSPEDCWVDMTVADAIAALTAVVTTHA